MTEPRDQRASQDAAATAGGNWWPVAAMAFGVALVLLAAPAALGTGPADPTPANAVFVLGVTFMGLAVSLAVHDLVRGSFSEAIRTLLAGAASIPVLAAVFLPTGFDVGTSTFYVLAVGVAAFIIRPSAAFGLFLLLSAIAPAAYLFLMTFANGVGI